MNIDEELDKIFKEDQRYDDDFNFIDEYGYYDNENEWHVDYNRYFIERCVPKVKSLINRVIEEAKPAEFRTEDFYTSDGVDYGYKKGWNTYSGQLNSNLDRILNK